MARWVICPDCGGRGEVPCGACDGDYLGAGDDEERDPCFVCIDGTEPCATCNTEGGWYDE